MIPIDTALNEIIDFAQQDQCAHPIDEHPLMDALGMRLAQPIHSDVQVPPADNSAMDGYALHRADSAQTLPIVQTVAAGVVPKPLQRGGAARILTGAELPEGADVVVMQEVCDTVLNERGETCIQVKQPDEIKPRQNIRSAGQEINIGDEVLPAGIRLTATELGVAASIGLTHLPVYRPLTIGVLSTGRELVEPGEPLPPGAIYNSNRALLMGLVQQLGHKSIDFGILPDELEATMHGMQQAADQVDLLISTGGASVGDEDHVKTALEQIGQLNMWKLAIKPGKPLMFGTIERACDHPSDGSEGSVSTRLTTPFFGLPGNPSAVLVTFLTVVRPYIMARLGVDPKYGQARPLRLPVGFEVSKPKKRQEYIRARYQSPSDSHKMPGTVDGANGTVLEAHPNQSSGMLSSAHWADGLAVIPIGTTLKRGDRVDFYPFDALLS